MTPQTGLLAYPGSCNDAAWADVHNHLLQAMRLCSSWTGIQRTLCTRLAAKGTTTQQHHRRSSRSSRLAENPTFTELLGLQESPSERDILLALGNDLEGWSGSPKLATAVLSGLAKERRPDVAHGVLKCMQAGLAEVDVFHCTSVIAAYEKAGRWRPALGLLARMPAIQVSPNEVSSNAAISACEKGGQWRPALGLLGRMSAVQSAPSEVSCSAAVSACEKGGQWRPALGLLGCMPSLGLELDVICCSAAISACEKGSRWRLALELLGLISAVRSVPNEVSYGAALSACEKGGQWQLALHLLQSMPALSVAPSIICYTAAISACERDAQWQQALGIIGSMCEDQLEPAGIMWGSILSGMVKSGCRDGALRLAEQLRPLWAGGRQTPPDATVPASRGRRPAGQSSCAPWPQVLLQAPGVVAVFKPSGVTGEELRDGLSAFLGARGRAGDVALASRLDARTSGVMPFALGRDASGAAHWLQAQFAGRLVSKEYLCLCTGQSLGPIGTEGEINSPLLVLEDVRNGRRVMPSLLGNEAQTRYQVLEVFPWRGHEDVVMLLLVRPKTGRMHQIRAHLASIGRPIVGDLAYAGISHLGRVHCPRLFLHCRRISLIDLDGHYFEPEAPMPIELLEVLSSLRSE